MSGVQEDREENLIEFEEPSGIRYELFEEEWSMVTPQDKSVFF